MRFVIFSQFHFFVCAYAPECRGIGKPLHLSIEENIDLFEKRKRKEKENYTLNLDSEVFPVSEIVEF